MNREEFIESGIIESYLLGNASSQEINLVNEMLRTHPDLIQEIERIENDLILVAAEGQNQASDKVKNNILAEITATKKIPFTPETKKSSYTLKFALAASTILFISSFIYNLYQYQNSNKLTAENNSYKKTVDSLNIDLNNSNVLISILRDTSSKSISLKGLPISPASFVSVNYNKKTKAVYVVNTNLPKPEQNKQYQLWAIVDGVPVDAGMIDLNAKDDFQMMKSIENPQAFAITLENKGGSTTPTLDQMYVLGNL